VIDYCFFFIPSLKLNASLKALEGERNQVYTQLSEVDQVKEDLTGKDFSLSVSPEEAGRMDGFWGLAGCPCQCLIPVKGTLRPRQLLQRKAVNWGWLKSSEV
jgi:hypothetical protein